MWIQMRVKNKQVKINHSIIWWVHKTISCPNIFKSLPKTIRENWIKSKKSSKNKKKICHIVTYKHKKKEKCILMKKIIKDICEIKKILETLKIKNKKNF